MIRRRLSKKTRRGLMVIVFVAAVSVAIYCYFWTLPNKYDKQYLNAITPAYNKQAMQMALVYKSLDRSLFVGSNTTAASNSQDLAYIQPVIKMAVELNDNLNNQDNLNVLPGTQWQQSVTQATALYNAMQQYVDDSKTLLDNYQKDVNYIGAFQVLEEAPKLTAFFNELGLINKSTTSAQLLSAANSASDDLSSITSALNNIQVPNDFQQINSTHEAVLNSANNAFIDTISGINGEGAEQITNTIKALDQAAAGVQGFSSINIASSFKANSIVYQEILKLEAEQPLKAGH